jgi:CRISPR/Cas system-associated exonuclease Cas4 (RecB family)
VQDILTQQGLLKMKEFVVEDEHRKGILDAICHYEDKVILYDFKTVHSRKFHYMRNAEIDAPQDMHYCLQALTYEAMLPFPVDSVRIAYISKDDLCIEEIEVPDFSTELTDDWQKLITCWTYQQEPTAKPMDWECGYCSYRSGCEQKIIKEPKPRKKKDISHHEKLEVKE